MTAFSRTFRVLAAAFAQIHPQLPGKSTNNLDLFLGTLKEANITRIAFLRHGKTGPSMTGKDFDRLLTPEGREQALTAGRIFGRDLKPFFSPLLVSSASRAVETAQLFLKSSDDDDKADLRIVEELYDGSIQPKGSALFRKMGYAPLRDYLESENETDREDARSVLGEYAHTAVDAIMDTAASSEPSKSPSTLCFVAHAVYLPASALGVATLVGCKDIDIAFSANTREAEGYLIDIPSSTVLYLSRGDKE
jgi:broad specificity phosphatase PhoE